MSKSQPKMTYGSYLQLEKILSAQALVSEVKGSAAHDEMLFIVIHQVYELWFKEILHELDSVIQMFNCNFVDERSIGVAVARVERVVEIEKLLIEQINILETLTPLDFLDFRSLLGSSSGFQSVQFRVLEHTLGLKHARRERYNEGDYYADYNEDDRRVVQSLEGQITLFDVVESWLERTPFLDTGSYSFLSDYRTTFLQMLETERKAVKESVSLAEAEKELRLRMARETEAYFESMLNQGSYETLRQSGKVRLSQRAFLAALFINLYRDQPILHLPYRLLSGLVDIDEHLNLWRYRHALMVLRMIGDKMGTGGSTGHSYLKATVEKHKIFNDLFNISTLLLPRSVLPELNPQLKRDLGFYFSVKD